MKIKLKHLVLVTAILASISVIFAFTAIDIVRDVENARRRITDNAARLIHTVTPIMLNALVVGDLATAEQILRFMNADNTLSRVVLLGPDGTTVFIDASSTTEPVVKAPAAFRALIRLPVVESRAEILGGGVSYGFLAVTPAIHIIENESWTRVRRALLETMVLLSVLLFALERVLHLGLRSLSKLAEAASQFGRGEHSVRLERTAIVESDRIGAAFNTMADDLAQALDDLRAREATNRQLAAAVEQASDAILTVDDRHRIVTWNGGATRLFAYSAEDAVGRHLADLLQGVSDVELLLPAEQPAAETPGRQFETLIVRNAGERLHVSASSTALLDEQARGVGWIIVMRDVTLRKQAEEKLEEAKRTAELANRSKSEFLANMSHELRTPLNAIIGFSSVIREEMFGPIGIDKYRTYIADIHNSGTHLLAIINDVLDVSAIEADRLEMYPSLCDPRELIDAAVRLVKPNADASGKVVEQLVADDAPFVEADERRLKQVLLNLLSNAIKFTPEGGQVKVEARLGARGGLDLIVRDTGMGMDEAGLQTALERFGQVDAGLNRKREGSGLGLPLAKGLVELHGGTLRIDSIPGRGTTVTVALPPERSQPREASPLSARADAAPASLSRTEALVGGRQSMGAQRRA